MDTFIKELEQEGMALKVTDDGLVLSGIRGKLSGQQLATLKQDHRIPNFIKEHKETLIAHLSKNQLFTSSNVLRKDQVEAVYKMSPLQEGILFHCLYNEELTVYITQFRLEIPSGLQVEAFRKAWNYVIQNHTILRTGFIYDKLRIPVQCVHKEAEIPMQVLDFSKFPQEEQDRKFDALLIEDRKQGFDFQRPPLIRITLVKVNEEAYKVILTKHHILWDGWSDQVIISEVLNAYAHFIKGEQPPTAKVDKYEDYIKYIDNIDPFKEKQFWESYLSGIEDPILLPFAQHGMDRNKGVGDFKKERLLFDKAFSEKITRYVKSRKITSNTLIQGIWSLLLSNYTGKEEVVFGVTVSGRPSESKYDKKVGLFINALPFRCQINPDQMVSEWLSEIQQNHVRTRAFQYTSLKQIQNWSGIKGDFFDSLLVVRNYPKPASEAVEDTVLPIQNVTAEENNNYLLSIEVGLEDEITVDFKFNSQILSADWVKMINSQFDHVLRQLVEMQIEKVGAIQVTTPSEATQILEEFNATKADYPKEKSVVQLIAEQAAKTPKEIAVVFEETSLTYSELETRSNQFARYLQSKGVGIGNTIGICVDRSLEMVIGLLGIMKSGNAYIPLDPSYPKERIDYILEDSQVAFLVSVKTISQDFEVPKKLEWIYLDEDYSALDNTSIEVNSSPTDLAYIIYTSGSTGRPKGVMIEHQALVNFLSSIQSTFQLKTGVSWLAVTTYSFDIFYLELYLPLIAGAQVIIAGTKTLADGYSLQSLISQHRPEYMQATPSTWQLLIDSGWKNEEGVLIVTGGEAIKESLKEALLKLGGPALWNFYGPTETTIYSVIQELKAGEAITIGRPIANTQIYILDPRGQLCSIGVEGELCIGGDGLARGYRNRPELTAEKFINNPVTGQGRIYLTGDVAKWLPTGEIEYIGRKDDQVKIRGFRIELEGIQTILEEYPQIKQGVVLAGEDNSGSKRLIAYVVPEGKLEKADVQAYLRTKLPEYMVPGVIIELPAFPLTPNGKLDKKAFPNPDAAHLMSDTCVPPQNEVQKQLIGIWQDVLGVDGIGIRNDFFRLGGHSLLATRVIASINRKLDANLRIKSLFENPTIEALSTLIEGGDTTTAKPAIVAIEPRPKQLPLSFSQERLWFIDKLAGSIHYHLPMVEFLNDRLDVDALEFALRSIVNRHEALRTVLKEENGLPFQEILPIDTWVLDMEACSSANDQVDIQARIEETLHLPFDLSTDHMLRGKLLNRGKEGYVLILVLHHIASDAWSGNILIREMVDLYLARVAGQKSRLNSLPIQYADYALWQRRYLNDEQLEKQLTYWEDKLQGLKPLDLPLDHPRPRIQSTNGNYINFELEQSLTDQIKAFCQQEGVTLFMFLLAVYKVLLHKYSGQTDICVGTPIANRDLPELENLIGFFVNSVALRSNLDDNLRFDQLLKQVKTTTVDAYQHQDTPFEKIVDRLVEERDISMSPLFQVAFALQNAPFDLQLKVGEEALLPDIRLDRPDTRESYKVAKYDLAMNVVDSGDGLNFTLDYCTDLFNASTIERMGGHFKILLQSILQRSDVSLHQLNILATTETKQLVEDFNDTRVAFPEDKTVVALFEAQVVKTPNQTAIICDGETLTYQELNQRANQLGHFLQKSGVTNDTLVGLCMDRSLEMIIGIWGILKAGGAYLPIDTAYPLDRISYLLEDAQINLVLGNASSAHLLTDHDHILLDTQWSQIAEASTNRVEIDREPQNLVYVIYTSGSTGLPKGVMIEHRNLINYVYYGLNNYNEGIDAFHFPLFTSISFDLTQTSIFLSLLSGGSLHIEKPTNDLIRMFGRIMANDQLNSIKLTPSHVQLLEGMKNTSLKKAILGGEALESNHLALLARVNPNIEVFNEYGPTEATIGCTVQIVQESDSSIGIGRPIWNSEVYILDKHLRVVPLGIPGELCIAGAGLARGYLNRPSLTEEKFVQVQLAGQKNIRVYKTGDLAKWHSSGTLEYMGRIDDQVKINGFRIEPGEIEALLNASEVVAQCAVAVKMDTNAYKRLCAYILPKGPYKKEIVRDLLKKHLPEYMIPSVWITVEEMPLTTNGKIDHNALPDPDFSDLIRTEYVAPRNETEAQLANIWEEILDVPKVSVYDRFFDLGGHSLLMARMVAAIRNKMNVELPLKILFQYPRLVDLADYLMVLNGVHQEANESEYEILDF